MDNTPSFAIILLKLPDGRVALQRRTIDAPYAPGQLGFFGGRIEEGESADECIIRELAEETSLPVSQMVIQPVINFVIPISTDYDVERRCFLFETSIDNLNFEVFEGDGAEAYTLEELKQKDDVSYSARVILEHLGV